MTNMTFTVQLDCTERLQTTIESLVKALLTPTITQANAPVEKKEEEAVAPPAEKKPRTRKKQDPPAETKVEEKTEEVVAEHQEEEAKPEPKAEEHKEEESRFISDAELRKAMKDRRAEVLGDKVNDPVLKQAINDKFRAYVASTGYNASTELPQDLRPAFLAFVASVTIDNIDNEKLPF